MIQIRNNVFETNSSSTHALCLKKDENSYISIDSVDWMAEYYIEPFTEEDYSKWDDPHVISSITDKLRYFWTIYNNLYLDDPMYSDSCTEWMRKVQSWLPKVKWVFQFDTNFDTASYCNAVIHKGVYLEDYEYVMKDENDCLIDYISTESSFKNFLLNGVIVFGDRNLPSRQWGDSAIEDKIEEFKKITSVTG